MDSSIDTASGERRRLRGRFGPGLVITASFIGPGTVTTATVTGADYGTALLWAIAFSVLATMVLQEMAARLGLTARLALGEAFRSAFGHPAARIAAIVMVLAAIGIGGAGYAAGDTAGTAVGLTMITGFPRPVVVALVGAAVFGLLATGRYRVVERVLGVLVAIMSAVFLLAAILARPDLAELVTGMLRPTVPDGALLTTIALVGTTIVPYNLFLHASIVQEKWPTADRAALRQARRDTVLSLSAGGLITLAIATTAGATLFTRGIQADSAAALAEPLRPALGPVAEPVLALGLFSAGLTSAVAGPFGAAYAITSVLGWSTDLSSPRFKAVWMAVVCVGVAIALTGTDPVALIVVAQAANGLLLPGVAVFLLVVMNRTSILGEHRNRLAGNLAGAVVVLVVTVLGLYQFADVLGVLPG